MLNFELSTISDYSFGLGTGSPVTLTRSASTSCIGCEN